MGIPYCYHPRSGGMLYPWYCWIFGFQACWNKQSMWNHAISQLKLRSKGIQFNNQKCDNTSDQGQTCTLWAPNTKVWRRLGFPDIQSFQGKQFGGSILLGTLVSDVRFYRLYLRGLESFCRSNRPRPRLRPVAKPRIVSRSIKRIPDSTRIESTKILPNPHVPEAKFNHHRSWRWKRRPFLLLQWYKQSFAID